MYFPNINTNHMMDTLKFIIKVKSLISNTCSVKTTLKYLGSINAYLGFVCTHAQCIKTT